MEKEHWLLAQIACGNISERIRQRGRFAKRRRSAPKEERVRQKGWVSRYGEQGESFDDLDLPDVERVVPLGEQERRHANITASPAAQ